MGGVGGGTRGWGSCECKPKYLEPIKYPFCKPLGIFTRFLVNFIKVTVLFKISVLKNIFSVCIWNCKLIKFATNNHLIITLLLFRWKRFYRSFPSMKETL